MGSSHLLCSSYITPLEREHELKGEQGRGGTDRCKRERAVRLLEFHSAVEDASTVPQVAESHVVSMRGLTTTGRPL
jgi:hypothetical protein